MNTTDDNRHDDVSLAAMAMLRQELHDREAALTAREERLWGWRLIASARDGECERILDELRLREELLRDRETTLTRREREVADREQAIAGRLAAAEEEHRAQVAHLRQEIARLRSRVLGTDSVGAT